MRKMGETQHDETTERVVSADRGEEDVDDLDETEEVIPYTYTITSYGADYPVDSLVNRVKEGDIIVPTFERVSEKNTEVVGFQRDYVWPRPKADKFIESLLLGLPVPGIFLVKEDDGAPSGTGWTPADSHPPCVLRRRYQGTGIPARKRSTAFQGQAFQRSRYGRPSSAQRQHHSRHCRKARRSEGGPE